MIVGVVSASKKSGDRRWPSRVSSRVSTDAAWISTSTDDASGSSAMVTVPRKSSKRPLVLDTIRWRTLKPTLEWETSSA